MERSVARGIGISIVKSTKSDVRFRMRYKYNSKSATKYILEQAGGVLPLVSCLFPLVSMHEL